MSAEARRERRTALDVATSPADHFRDIAKALTRPEVGAASSLEVLQPKTHDLNDLAAELATQVAKVNAGDLSRAEGMLIAQAHTLENLFNNLLRTACTQGDMVRWDMYLRMALRAQNQCRMTVATLGELKNPAPVAFVRQANIAHGPQQVNNGAVARVDGEKPQSKVLEVSDGERLDTGTTSTASGADPALATVGEVDGSAHGARQGGRRAERLEGRNARGAA